MAPVLWTENVICEYCSKAIIRKSFQVHTKTKHGTQDIKYHSQKIQDIRSLLTKAVPCQENKATSPTPPLEGAAAASTVVSPLIPSTSRGPNEMLVAFGDTFTIMEHPNAEKRKICEDTSNLTPPSKKLKEENELREMRQMILELKNDIQSLISCNIMLPICLCNVIACVTFY